jgi:hypothetical protein
MLGMGRFALGVALLCGWLGAPEVARAAEAEGSAVEQIVGILQERGLIDGGQAEQILAKHAAEPRAQALPAVAAAVDRFEWSGDLRLRYETFLYQHDPRGFDEENRHRFRYRARIGAKAKVNDWITAGFRLASGATNPTSTNQTLGSGNDFDKETLGIDLAYADIRLALALEGLDAHFVGGKIPNPFLWKVGRDILIWDNDITPEGGALTFGYKPLEETTLFANVGGFIDVENRTSSDPKVFAVQVGGTQRAGIFEFGLRGSGYAWRSLDTAFETRAALNGTLGAAQNAGNLVGAGFDDRANVGEVSSYVTLSALESWPLTLFGTAVRNFSADDGVIGGFAVNNDQDAFLVGLEAGDKAKVVKLGIGFARVEANSVVSMFTDSDIFDGTTNRQGFAFWVSRALMPNADVALELFASEEIEDTGAFDDCAAGACGPYENSISNSDRVRGRLDLELKF